MVLKTPSPALPLRFRGREQPTDSGLGFVSLENPFPCPSSKI